jgi:hypothetical protein
MKVLIENDCAARGQYLEAGKVYELDNDVAAELLRIGRAVEAPAEEPKAKATRKPKAEDAATITE